MKTVAEVIGLSPLEPGGALTAASAEEADRSAAITGRGARGADQGGDRRIADLRLPARPRHPQAPGAGRGFKSRLITSGSIG